jgi:hypothetical protein
MPETSVRRKGLQGLKSLKAIRRRELDKLHPPRPGSRKKKKKNVQQKEPQKRNKVIYSDSGDFPSNTEPRFLQGGRPESNRRKF